jgi:Zn finger protein HypA/HybF involved in hydrogenase expression
MKRDKYATLPIWCPHCERQTQQLIVELKAHEILACPLCGELTESTPEFLAVLRNC